MKKNNKYNFILTEYQECFSHMRHYDNNTSEILKLIFSFYAAIITLSLGVYEFIFQKNSSETIALLYISIILFFSFCVGIIVIVLVVSNRKYFVKVAQQVNSIRHFYSQKINFYENKLPTDDNQPKVFNIKSSQMVIIFLIVFINSVVLFFAINSLFFYILNYFLHILSALIGVIYLFLNFILIRKYLKK